MLLLQRLPALAGAALLFLTTAQAAVLQIDFTGVITGGAVAASYSDGSNATADLTLGTTIQGAVVFDLGIAPPAVQVVNGTSIDTQIEDINSGIYWISTQYTFSLPGNAPTSILYPTLPHAVTGPLPRPGDALPIGFPLALQLLRIGRPITTGNCCDVVGVSHSITELIATPTTEFGRIDELHLLLSSFTPFLPASPDIPTAFTVPGINTPGSFHIQRRLSEGTTNESLDISGTFQLTSATAFTPTPEPGTWLAGVIALAGLARCCYRKPSRT